MKKTVFVLLVVFGLVNLVFGQSGNKELPRIDVKTLEGGTFNTGDIQNLIEGETDGPIIVNFWATWCKPCILELMTIADEYEDWVDETGVKLIAISIDDARNSHKVAPFVNGKGWDYEVYIDENQEFKRAMSVNNPPHTFILNSKREIVWDHSSYTPGDEEELFEVLKKVAAGEELESHGDKNE